MKNAAITLIKPKAQTNYSEKQLECGGEAGEQLIVIIKLQSDRAASSPGMNGGSGHAYKQTSRTGRFLISSETLAILESFKISRETTSELGH